MAVHNAIIADTLRHIADLLEIEGANPFRIRAYRRAAQTIGGFAAKSAAKMVAEGKPLVGLPGIGKDLAAKITELVATGQLVALQVIEARTPTTLAAPSLASAQSACTSCIRCSASKTVKDLEHAAKTHKIRDLRDFTAKTEERILAEIKKTREREHPERPNMGPLPGHDL